MLGAALCQTEPVWWSTPAEVNGEVWILTCSEDFEKWFLSLEEESRERAALAMGQQGSSHRGGNRFLDAQTPAAYLTYGSFSAPCSSMPGLSCSWKPTTSGTFKMGLVRCCLDHSELNSHQKGLKCPPVLPAPFPQVPRSSKGCNGLLLQDCVTRHFTCCSRAGARSKPLFLTAWATDVASYNWSHMGTTS